MKNRDTHVQRPPLGHGWSGKIIISEAGREGEDTRTGGRGRMNKVVKHHFAVNIILLAKIFDE